MNQIPNMTASTPVGLREGPIEAARVWVGRVADIEPGESVRIDAELLGTSDAVAVFHSDNGQFYAVDDTCTHEVASLADGWVEGDQVECPIHSAKFCLSTGRALCLPATRPVGVHRVEIDDDGVWLIPAGAPDVR